MIVFSVNIKCLMAFKLRRVLFWSQGQVDSCKFFGTSALALRFNPGLCRLGGAHVSPLDWLMGSDIILMLLKFLI